MRIRLGELRSLIRDALLEVGGAPATKPRPMSSNPMTSSIPDREQLGRITVRDAEDPESISPHLRDVLYDEEDCWGPVPPVAEDPHAGPDLFAKDFNVIPTSSIKR